MRCSRQSGHGGKPSPYWKNKAPTIVAAAPAATTSAAVTAGLRGVNGAVVAVIDGLGGRVGHRGGGCHCRRATDFNNPCPAATAMEFQAREIRRAGCHTVGLAVVRPLALRPEPPQQFRQAAPPLTDSPPLLYSRLGAFARPCPCGGIGRRA